MPVEILESCQLSSNLADVLAAPQNNLMTISNKPGLPGKIIMGGTIFPITFTAAHTVPR